MVYGMPPPPAPRKPPISGVDLGISLTAMILTLAFGAFAVVIGMFLLLVLESCPPALCSVDGGVSAVLVTWLIAAVIGLLGFTVTIVQLVRRALAWPYAVGMLVLCVATCVIGVYVYGDAVGAEEGWLLGNY
ncbi:hypothetical protein BH11ACT6_BH11ACT6_07620 [soil metagenome]